VPDGSDAHLSRYPVPYTLVDAQIADTATGFTFANTLIGLRN
jgi:hypothetical protein